MTLTSPTPDGSKPSTSPWPFPKDREPILSATPIAYKATSSVPGLGSPHSPALYSQYDFEFQDHWIGPVEVDDFLDFLPKAKVRMPRAPRHLIGLLHNDAYSKQKLNLILQEQFEPYIGDKFEIARTEGDPSQPHEHPDFLLYPKGIVPIAPGRALPSLKKAELLIKVKHSTSHDPFQDWSPETSPDASTLPDEPSRAHLQFLKPPAGYEQRSNDPRHTRGQLIAYATEACARQHRQSYFSILICQHRARFIRWDRSGAVVSEDFDCSSRKGIALMGKFLWRFTHASPSSRGWDPTVVASTPEDEVAFSSHPSLRKWYDQGCVVTLLVWDDDRGEYRSFLVSRPVISPRSLTGRGTRGYWALDTVTQQVAFIKDTWTTAFGVRELEGTTLKILLSKGVRNIPEFYCHGYVPNDDGDYQHTRANCFIEYCYREAAGCKIIPYVHYRLVSKTVGRNLIEASESSSALLKATSDAFTALSDAYHKCGIMHRDVSIGNIVVDESGTGILIDWELSCHIPPEGGAWTHGRAGTWRFMAAELQSHRPPCHHPQHDIESFYWVIMYATLRWYSPELDEELIKECCHILFDACNFNYGQKDGNGVKIVEILSGQHLHDLRQKTFSRGWLDKARLLCGQWLLSETPPKNPFEQFAETWKAVFTERDLVSVKRQDRLPPRSRPSPFEAISLSVTDSFTSAPRPIPRTVSLPSHSVSYEIISRYAALRQDDFRSPAGSVAQVGRMTGTNSSLRQSKSQQRGDLFQTRSAEMPQGDHITKLKARVGFPSPDSSQLKRSESDGGTYPEDHEKVRARTRGRWIQSPTRPLELARRRCTSTVALTLPRDAP
ncbi:hypothetical protein NLI96_g10059 [Meripilus lineatus]|uniref:Fungal-type protein kinase domain-containing protein n=1 Tax=Meripilus lineatus TaxID=2056292 RepID=A0AAD5UUD1_9APHY|nr:hypothetical protein NLI96_g10059 [Physisporinus lineatus]